MKAHLGVDWSATEVECALGVGEVDPPRPIKGTRRTLDGVRELLERVRARAPGVNEVHVVIEAGAPGAGRPVARTALRAGRDARDVDAGARRRLPALEQALPVLTRGWVLRVIRAVPTALHAERVAEAQLQAVFKGSGARETTRTAVVEAVRACSAPWLTAAVARVQEIHVLQLVAQIELLSEQVANVEKELDALTRDMDIRAHLESVARVGTRIPPDADPANLPQRGSISASWASVARASRRRAAVARCGEGGGRGRRAAPVVPAVGLLHSERSRSAL